MNVLPAALSLSECAGLEPYRETLKGFMEGLDQCWTSAVDSTQQCLVLAVGITVQEQLDTPELCQVSAPTVELQQFRNTGLHIHILLPRTWALSLWSD